MAKVKKKDKLKSKKKGGKLDSFRNKKRTKEDVKKRANQKSGQFDSVFKDKYKVWKCGDGKNLIRILPETWEDAEHYGLDIYVNYQVGADNQSYLSLSKMKNEKDPLEEAKREAESEGDKKLASALSPRKRVLYWIIDRNAEDEGPQLWSAPWTVDRDISNMCIDEDTDEVLAIENIDEGCDLRFYKEGKGLNTEYNPAKMKMLKPSKLHDDDDQMLEWLEYIKENPLPDTLQFYGYDHISAVFDGGASKSEDDDDDDDDDDDKPKKGKKNKAKGKSKKPVKSSKKKSKKDDDEDDDEDEPDEDEDDEDEDDEDEDEDDEDDDEGDDDDDDDDSDDDDDDDDDDDEPEEKPKGKSKIRDRLKNMKRNKKK